VLNKRYGGWYKGDRRRHPKSITHMEYLEARRQGKIIIPCVHSDLEQDRHRINGAAKSRVASGATNRVLLDAMRSLTPGYADTPELLVFLEEVRKADRDNYICYYRTVSELVKEVEGRLRGLSRHICQWLVTRQVGSVSRMSTAAIATQSIADVVEGGLFVEPPFAERKPPTVRGGGPLSERLVRSAGDGGSTLLIGGAGRGKSIMLAMTFLQVANAAIGARSRRLPFFLSLRGLGRHVSLDTSSALDGFFRDAGRTTYPALDLRNIDPIFFVDGVDELDPQCTVHDLDRLAKDGVFRRAAAACMRSDVFERTANIQGEFSDTFDSIYELLEWTPSHSTALAERFCTSRSRPDLMPALQEFIESEEGSFLNSPLLVTLFFYVFAESGLAIPPDLQGEIDVFRHYLMRLSSREVVRLGTRPSDRERQERALLSAWSWGSWEVYRRRMAGERPRLPVVTEAARARLDARESGIVDTPAFTAIFDIVPHTWEVSGTVHERFMEYMVSLLFVDSCAMKQQEMVSEYLVLPIRFKMNAYIKAMWVRHNDEAVSSSMEYLWWLFRHGISLQGEKRTPLLSNALYYLSYGLNPLPDIASRRLRQAADLAADETYVRNSALFGLVRLGDTAAEQELYDSLTADPEADSLNRGAHLVYFRDWLTADPPPFYDDCDRQWENTYEGLLGHVVGVEKRFVHSKRIDLVTMRSLLQSRGTRYPMAEPDFDRMSEALDRNSAKWQDYACLLEAARKELALLRSEWERLP
jgi:hypothetical protein